MQTIIKPIIYPITPIMPIYAYNITGSTFSIALIVLSALAVIGTSVLIAWVLSKVMASKGMVSKPIFNLIASGAIGLCGSGYPLNSFRGCSCSSFSCMLPCQI